MLLEACQVKVQSLSARITRSTAFAQEFRKQDCDTLGLPESKNRFSSLPDLRTSLQSITMRICHHCHTPQSEPVHVGVPTGVGQCTLPHWEHCSLDQAPGYDKHKKLWTGCTEALDDTKDEEDLVTDSNDDEIGDGSENDVTVKHSLPKNITEAAELLDKGTVESRGVREAAGLLGSLAGLQVGDDDSDEDTDDEEDRLAREELEKLKNRVEEQQKQIDADRALAVKIAKKAKKKEERQKIEQERAELLAREKTQLQERALLSTRTKKKPQSISSTDHSKMSLLKSSSQDHAARQQKEASERAKLVKSHQLNIEGIRKLPGMPKQVDEYLQSIQSRVPSLSQDPSAADSSGVRFQPKGVFDTSIGNTNKGGLAVDTGYVYVAELGKLVPIVSSVSSGTVPTEPANPVPQLSDSEVSADEECPVSPSPGHRLAWKRDGNGDKYCEEVQLRDASPEIVTTWVKRSDGRIYKEQVSHSSSGRSARDTSSGTRAPLTTTPINVHEPVQGSHRQSTRQVRAPPRREDRQPTFIAAEERAGKETSVPSLVRHARLCPVSWTAKITSDQMNPVVWSWAYISELVAARSGQAPELDAGELEARLQHFLNVLEVTLQTSDKTDYMGDSWKVGRLYHNKVQAKVDKGATTWCKMADRWENATLPHELMAAQQELAPRYVRPKTKDTDRVKDGGDTKKVCGLWNGFETKGVCKWESDNPGEKCNRIHECTYCKNKRFKPLTHQRLFWPKRLAAGTD